MHDPDDAQSAARAEHRLLGGTRGKNLGFWYPGDPSQSLEAVASRFVVRVRFRGAAPRDQSLLLCPHDDTKGRRPAFVAGTEFDIEWSESRSVGDGSEAEFRRILKAWVLLGSLGCRASRAAGSVWPLGRNFKQDDFLREVKGLWPDAKLPRHLSVKVLRDPAKSEIEAWHPPVRRSGRQWQQLLANQPDLLRAVTTDVLAFGSNHDGAFGYGGADGRKASPVKLKVGLFDEGYRLIAIVDRRDGRDGKVKAAIAELASAGKPLGQLLKDANLT